MSKMTAKLFIFVTIISLIVPSLKGSIIENSATMENAPRNQAIIANETAIFVCSVTQPRDEGTLGTISFEESITSTSGRTISIDDRIVYNHHGDVTRQTRYNASKEGPHSFQLHIEGVSLDDGGKYSCSSPSDVRVSGSAELIVIEETPNCQTNATTALDVGEVVMMTCEVTSQGRWAPVIHWSNKRNDVIVQNETIWENPSVNARTVRYTVTKTVDASDNDDVYVAKTHFEAVTDVGEHEARNTPLYKHIFTFDPLVVKVPSRPRNIFNVPQTPIDVEKLGPALTAKNPPTRNGVVTRSPTVIEPKTSGTTETIDSVTSTVATIDSFDVYAILVGVILFIVFVIVGSLITVLLTGCKSCNKDKDIDVEKINDLQGK